MFKRGVAVIGLGYIGLPTSAVLASHGIRVFGVDVDAEVVAGINAGRALITEADLGAAVATTVAQGLLSAHTTVPEADVFLIAVPTPFDAQQQPDLSYVESATRAIAPQLRSGDLVILESTSPPGTTDRVSAWIAEERPELRLPHENDGDLDVFVAHCPERVLPGQIMRELVENDRVVGGITPECARRAAEFYGVICRGEVSVTDARSAEMAKLVENSFRDVNIAFANELAEVCEHLELDVREIIRLANRHPRVNVLSPGPGVGGHCIAVDPWFIVAAAPEHARLIRMAREINDARPASVAAAIDEVSPDGANVACLGLAFKADVDDLRESPAVDVVRLLADRRPDLKVVAVEPHVTELPVELAGRGLSFAEDPLEAVRAADVVALLVDHGNFRAIGAEDLVGRRVVDTRGFWRHLN